MSISNHFLIARNKWDDREDLRVIRINGHFIYELPEIDLFTMGFYNENDLRNYLRNKKLLESGSYDFFIVTKKADEIVGFQEVVYLNETKRGLDKIAKSFLNGSLKDTEGLRKDILIEFSDKMGTDNEYYDMAIYDKFNIYPKYLEYFYNKRGLVLQGNMYKEGGWAIDSYKLIRNIAESFTRFEEVGYGGKTEADHCMPFRNAEKQRIKKMTEVERLPYNGDLFTVAEEDD